MLIFCRLSDNDCVIIVSIRRMLQTVGLLLYHFSLLYFLNNLIFRRLYYLQLF